LSRKRKKKSKFEVIIGNPAVDKRNREKMPFMKGPAPWRRTLQYLQNGSLIFKDNVKIFSINFQEDNPASDGLNRFVFWHLAQIQYKNPKVQCLQMKNMSLTPHITVYEKDGKEVNKVFMNCYKRNSKEILDWCVAIVGKSKEQLEQESFVNPANFTCENNDYSRYCICQIPGQISCPGFKKMPEFMRNKYKMEKKDELDEIRKVKSDQQALKEYFQRESM
jgi:small subunit ribosomal protein S25